MTTFQFNNEWYLRYDNAMNESKCEVFPQGQIGKDKLELFIAKLNLHMLNNQDLLTNLTYIYDNY